VDELKKRKIKKQYESFYGKYYETLAKQQAELAKKETAASK
jgi:hypothetical protein